jgi:cold shock CspA family protein
MRDLIEKLNTTDEQPPPTQHPPEQEGRLYGRIIGWRHNKGWGFVARDDGDAWLHVKFVEEGTPRSGCLVSYVLHNEEGKWQARRVKVIEQ